MFVCLFVCLCVCLFVCLFVKCLLVYYYFISLFVYLSFCLFDCLFVCTLLQSFTVSSSACTSVGFTSAVFWTTRVHMYRPSSPSVRRTWFRFRRVYGSAFSLLVDFHLILRIRFLAPTAMKHSEELPVHKSTSCDSNVSATAGLHLIYSQT